MTEEKRRVPNRSGYQLISPEGDRLGIYETAREAAIAAEGFWPGVGQIDDDNPNGWDIEAIR